MGKSELHALVDGLRAGKDEALSGLYSATSPIVHRFCLRLSGSGEIAEDLLQETYLKCMISIGSLKDDENILSWLFSVARNAFIDRCRRERSGRRVDMTPELVSRVEVSAADGQEGVLESGFDVRRALAQISNGDMRLLLLVDVVGQSYQEAADSLGLSPTQVRGRLHLARRRFQKAYVEPMELAG